MHLLGFWTVFSERGEMEGGWRGRMLSERLGMVVGVSIIQIQFKLKKTLVVPQGAILLWSWQARKIMNT